MIDPVLCISRKAILKDIGIVNQPQGNYAYSFDISNVPDKDFHFLDRSLADSQNPEDHAVAQHIPQVLPYVLVTCGDEVLTYSRAKGAESRLHGKLSCGFGGHVELSDINVNMLNVVAATMRELNEELRIDDTKPMKLDETKIVLLDTTDNVGQVHMGYVYTLELSSKDMIDPDLSEIHLPEWKTYDQLAEEIKQYENWSQTLIGLKLEAQ